MRLTPEIVTAIQQLALEQRGPSHLHLLDEILANPAARTAFAFVDDEERRAALVRHGFTQPGEPMHYLVRDVPERPEPPPLPTGFRYRTVGPDDVRERVSVHRDVWAPSRLTESSYSRVRAQWPYRESLDCVIEAPDGRFAAYCLCWLDDAHRVGEFEPVGVRAEFRRRGLGAAVCTFALGASPRGTGPAGDRLLRHRAGVRALPITRLSDPRLAHQLLPALAATLGSDPAVARVKMVPGTVFSDSPARSRRSCSIARRRMLERVTRSRPSNESVAT